MSEFRTSTFDGQTFVHVDSGEGPLIVLLHGFPDTPGSWDGIRGRLNDGGFRTVAPYLRGYHPQTVVPGRGYDAASTAADVVRLLDALGEERAVLVGHDWGASIVYAAAHLHPSRTSTPCTPAGRRTGRGPPVRHPSPRSRPASATRSRFTRRSPTTAPGLRGRAGRSPDGSPSPASSWGHAGRHRPGHLPRGGGPVHGPAASVRALAVGSPRTQEVETR